GKPLPLTAGAKVTVEYRLRQDIRSPREVVGIRTERGEGVAQAVESGNDPVTLNLPLFRLVARQSEPPSRRVLMTVVDDNQHQSTATMEPGQTAQVGGLTITLLGSIAVAGPRAGRVEGAPYSVS